MSWKHDAEKCIVELYSTQRSHSIRLDNLEQRSFSDAWKTSTEMYATASSKQIKSLQDEVLALKDILEKAGIIQEAENVVELKDNRGKPVLNTVNKVFDTPDNGDDFCFGGCGCE